MFDKDDYIQEGVNPAPGALVLACTVGDDYDNPQNRIFVRRSEEASWLDFRVSREAFLSVDATADGSAYVLGENGSVVEFDWRTPASQDELRASRRLHLNPAVSEMGPLRRLRVVGGKVICAGSVGQMYRLEQGRFEAFPQLATDGEGLTIEDLSGEGPARILAVTSEGIAASFDGSAWTHLDLPTNVSLTRICPVGDGRYAIAGKNGTIVLGQREQWSLVEPIDTERSYWGIAARDGVVFAAYSGGIDVLRDGDLRPLEIPGAADFEFAQLATGPDGVWSFAGQTIGVVRDDVWRTIHHSAV